MKRKHWTQTVEGRAKLRRLMKAKHKSGVIARGKACKVQPVVVDVRSAIIYLQQAESKGPAMARLLGALALLTLLGEDK